MEEKNLICPRCGAILSKKTNTCKECGLSYFENSEHSSWVELTPLFGEFDEHYYEKKN
jgi:RNA polymerase subunit RPABC4/transcription elongation factor Spt4